MLENLLGKSQEMTGQKEQEDFVDKKRGDKKGGIKWQP